MGVVKKALKSMFKRRKWHILRGDTVEILSGKDAGQQGVVRSVIRDVKIPRVVVEGRNLLKRHIKRTANNPGGIIPTESPLHYSNVALVDPKTNAPVRVSWRWLDDGTKVRVSRGKKASGSVIPRPEMLALRKKPRPLPGPKDTPLAEATRPTVTEDDAPSHRVFRQGIFPTAQQAAAQPKGARTFSCTPAAASGSASAGVAAPAMHWRPAAMLAARQLISSWHGFAASGLRH